MFKLNILGKPMSVNQTYRKTNYSYYMTKKGKEYMSVSSLQAKVQYKKKPLEKDLEVEYKYYFGDKRIHDHLNFNKALNDALTGIVWIDDKQIKISHHYTMYDKNNPRVELIIKEIGNKH